MRVACALVSSLCSFGSVVRVKKYSRFHSIQALVTCSFCAVWHLCKSVSIYVYKPSCLCAAMYVSLLVACVIAEAAPPASSSIHVMSAKELDSHGLPQQGTVPLF